MEHYFNNLSFIGSEVKSWSAIEISSIFHLFKREWTRFSLPFIDRFSSLGVKPHSLNSHARLLHCIKANQFNFVSLNRRLASSLPYAKFNRFYWLGILVGSGPLLFLAKSDSPEPLQHPTLIIIFCWLLCTTIWLDLMLYERTCWDKLLQLCVWYSIHLIHYTVIHCGLLIRNKVLHV